MLCLLPFYEAKFCQQHQLAATFVGHTLAKALPLNVDRKQAAEHLALPADKQYFCVMPGSRHGEVKRMLPLFFYKSCNNYMIINPN